MRIDAHQHFWRYDPITHGWITDDMRVIRRDFLPGDLQAEIDAAGIGGTVAVQADESEAETRFLLELSEDNAFIKAVVGWADLKDPRVEERLHQWAGAPKLKGFRAIMQGRPDEEYLANPAFREGVRTLGRLGFTYDLLVYHDQLPSLIRFTEACPDQPFILDHIAKPAIARGALKPWREHIRILAQQPNILCKLSGMVTEAEWKSWRYEDLAPYMEVVGEHFGVDRLCFGTDWPVCLVAGGYGTVAGVMTRFLAQLPEEARERVWGGNAKTFYKID